MPVNFPSHGASKLDREMSMPKLPGKLLTFCAAALLAAGATSAIAAEKEKTKKPSREVKTAQGLHVQITQQMGVHDDLELQEYVQRLGEKLAKTSERPELEWKFTIVDTDDVNAFATMGGYVYISRGILPYMQNEAELAAVLGHEIGHIAARHLQDRQKKSTIAGLASAATAIFTGMPALADLTNMAGAAIVSGGAVAGGGALAQPTATSVTTNVDARARLRRREVIGNGIGRPVRVSRRHSGSSVASVVLRTRGRIHHRTGRESWCPRLGPYHGSNRDTGPSIEAWRVR